MKPTATKNSVFAPVPSRAETKSEITDKTVQAMIKAEVESRKAKTARLQKARLAMEASQPAPEKPAGKKTVEKTSASKKPVGRKTAKSKPRSV